MCTKYLFLALGSAFSLQLSLGIAPTQAAPPLQTEKFVQNLASSDASARKAAVEFFAVNPRQGSTVVANLNMLLQDPDDSVRNVAAAALGRIKDESSYEPLTKAFREKKLLRTTAVAAIGSYGDRAVPEMIRLLDDPDKETRMAAMQFLVARKDQASAAALLKKFETDADYRQMLSYMLPQMKDLTLAPLIAFLQNSEPEVAEMAAFALRRFELQYADEEVAVFAASRMPGILKDLGSEDAKVQQRAIMAVGRLGPFASEAGPRIGSLLRQDKIPMALRDLLRIALLQLKTAEASSLAQQYRGVGKR